MVAGNIPGALIEALRVLIKAPETDCVILLGIMGFFTMQPIPPETPPEGIEQHINNILTQLDKAFREIREMSHHYQKPVVAGTELPFAVADMEERISQSLGAKGFALYKTPDETTKVMSHLVNYGRYLAQDVEVLN
jgi:hypothetical protein